MTTTQESTIYDFILKLFVGNDPLRPPLLKPGIIDGSVYATNAHICIRFDKNLCNVDYSNNTNFPNAKNVMENLELQTYISIKTDDLLQLLYDCELEFETNFETCKKCNGNGSKYCDCCNNETDCKKCNGDGFVDVEKPFAKIECFGENIFLMETKVNPRYVYKVVQTALHFKTENIQINYCLVKKNKLLFSFADVEILVMGITS